MTSAPHSPSPDHPSPAAMPTRAMVLAAGLGKRMRPLTATTPKPLIEVAGRSLIDHALTTLTRAGVAEAIVNVHYLADLVEVHVKRRAAPRITISDERAELLETGGGIAKALPLLGEGPFYSWNADSFWIEGASSNLRRMAAAWDDARMDALLLLASTVSSVGYDGLGDFTMDTEGRLKRRTERNVSAFVYCGVALLHPRLFADAPKGRFSLNVLFDKAIEAGRLCGLRLDGTWLHVGTPEAIREAELAIQASAA